MYHFTNHQLYHQNAYQQQCPIFVDHTKHGHPTLPADSSFSVNQYEVVQHNSSAIQPDTAAVPLESQIHTSNSEKKSKVIKNKTSVDTSNFSIEERLVAAVWVHERKTTKTSMSQIKHDFRQRFGREPPAKNTLLVWERKLFATGSVHDAPRPGRPVNRCSRMAEVAASVRAAPALSLRARALALRLPRTTLRTILRTDLAQASADIPKDTGPNIITGKHQTKKTVKKVTRRKLDPSAEPGGTSTYLTAAPRDAYT